MPTQLIELVERLAGRKVVLVGDLMLDKYLYGDAERLSPDAPVPVLCYRKEDARLGGAGRGAADLATPAAPPPALCYRKEDARLGGAGRVAADLATLCCHVRVVSILGKDDTA